MITEEQMIERDAWLLVWLMMRSLESGRRSVLFQYDEERAKKVSARCIEIMEGRP